MDITAICLAYFAAGLIRLGNPFHEQVSTILAVLVPIYFAIALPNHVFTSANALKPRIGTPRCLTTFLATLSAVLFVIFALQAGESFSRILFVIGGMLALIVLLPLGRWLLAAVAVRLFGRSLTSELVLIDGLDLNASETDAVILPAERLGSPLGDDPIFLDRLGRCVEQLDRLIVLCPPTRRAFWTAVLRGSDVRTEVLVPELDDLGALGIATFANRRTLIVASGPLGTTDRLLKRAMDLVLILTSLPITLLLLAVTALAIKLDTRGPVVFSQSRVGLGNRQFQLYKFRSMRVAALDDHGTLSTARDDDRVTRVGRFIRATSLDELPQIFNVLAGSMSIVGPRPHALGSRAGDQLFWNIDTTYWHRHAVKPGMTGLAQIRGHRGSTENEIDLRNRLGADLEYLSAWSIWRDIVIIVLTVRVLVHRNAF